MVRSNNMPPLRSGFCIRQLLHAVRRQTYPFSEVAPMSTKFGNETRAEKLNRRREGAAGRQEAYDKLTTQQKLARLDARPGESRRERARLEKELERGKKR